MKEITVLENGPVLLRETNGQNIALCRCAKSQNKPFCDGFHSKCGFKAKAQVIWQQSTDTEEILEVQ